MDSDGLPVQRAVVAMGGVLLAITTLLPWMTLAVHVSITRSSTSPYNITPPGGNGVSVAMFSFTKGWILVPLVVLGAALVGGGAALVGPLRKVGVYGAIMAVVVLAAEGLGYFHLHSAGSTRSFAVSTGTATSTSSVSLTPAVGGWITIVAILALLAWAVMNGSSSASRRETRSRSKARGMDPAVAPPETGFAMASPGESVGGADPSDVPLPSFAAGSQTAVAPSPPLSIPVTDPAAPARPAGWYPDETDATKQRYHDGTAWTQHTAPR